MAGAPLIQDVEIAGIPGRSITKETCEKFRYGKAEAVLKKGEEAQRVHVAPYFDSDGQLVAQKIRTIGKDFSVRGSLDNALPFGAHAFQKTGKKIVVTEGEIDALSMSQVQGNQWPVVSIPNGAAGAKKHVAKCLDYYRGFDEVVLMFDSDEPGRKAAQECAEVLGSRAKIAELPQGFKDPNDMLQKGKTDALIDAMWKAKKYQPENIVELSSLKERVKAAPVKGLSWWSKALTDLTYGIRPCEIYAFGAGTGVGKTDFFTQEIEHLAVHHGQPVGVFSLEQAVVDTAKRIAGKHAGKMFHVPDGGWTEAELDAAWDAISRAGKIFLYDSFGVNEWETVKSKMEYLIHTEGVRHFFLDHLTAFAAGADDERKLLDAVMADMGAFVAKHKVTIFLISHLTTPDQGKSHEEGGRVTIRQFRGSRSIGYWSAFMFGLERDQQADEEAIRTTTTFRVLKDRFTGRATGKVFFLGYDQETGRLFETKDPESQQSTASAFRASEGAAGTPADF